MAETCAYSYVPHRQTEMRLAGEAEPPAMVADQLARGGAINRFNAWLA